jgi:putative ABC transport system permease protein
MESFVADIRQAFRMMRKNPGFTIVALSALALGIGANIAIFSVVNAVMLQPLPYPQPDRIMKLGRKYAHGAGYSNSIPKYMAWRHNDVFESMAAYDQSGPGLNLGSGGDHPEQIKGAHVSRDYFKVFGVGPVAGRTFTRAEDLPGGAHVAILSHQLWKSHFAGDANMLGRAVVLNSEAYTVIGIMPADFRSDPAAEVWIPLQADPNSTNQGHYLSVAGRLKPGASVEAAAAQMKLAGEEFRREYPKWMDKDESVAVTPMRDAMVQNVRTALWVLLGAVAFVLLIACANVANLLLARAASRQKELAIRAAIGANRWRVVQQLLTESILLAALGGVLGFLLGAWGVRALLLLAPGRLPRLTDATGGSAAFSILDWRIAVFAIGVSLATGILFGLFPALQISNPDLASTLKETSGRSGSGLRQNRARGLLVVTEMALALVLLVAATLLIRTFIGLRSADAGIDVQDVVTFQTSLAGNRYATTPQVDRFTTQVLRQIEALPGVKAAATAIALPTETEIDLPFTIAGKPPANGNQFNGDVQWRSTTPHYFSVFKIPLLRGRSFSETDAGNSAPVVVINQAMATKYWPKEDPIGQVVTIGKGLGPQFADPPRQVIGVVGTVRETGLGYKNVEVMYLPASQVPEGLTSLANSVIPLSWAIRSSMSAKTVSAAVEHEIQVVDNQMPVSKVRTMTDVMAEGTERESFNMLLLSIFAGIALLLAAIGIYGLMSYSVEQRSQELGIRLALGAGRGDMLRLVISQGMKLAGIGVVAGLAIAYALAHLLASLLYGVKATDPITFALVAIVLAVVALAATLAPARRAMKVDPIVALRCE